MHCHSEIYLDIGSDTKILDIGADLLKEVLPCSLTAHSRSTFSKKWLACILTVSSMISESDHVTSSPGFFCRLFFSRWSSPGRAPLVLDHLVFWPLVLSSPAPCDLTLAVPSASAPGGHPCGLCVTIDQLLPGVLVAPNASYPCENRGGLYHTIPLWVCCSHILSALGAVSERQHNWLSLANQLHRSTEPAETAPLLESGNPQDIATARNSTNHPQLCQERNFFPSNEWWGMWISRDLPRSTQHLQFGQHGIHRGLRGLKVGKCLAELSSAWCHPIFLV